MAGVVTMSLGGIGDGGRSGGVSVVVDVDVAGDATGDGGGGRGGGGGGGDASICSSSSTAASELSAADILTCDRVNKDLGVKPRVVVRTAVTDSEVIRRVGLVPTSSSVCSSCTNAPGNLGSSSSPSLLILCSC